MLIGAPRETKTFEFRAGLTPASVRQLAAAGHRIVVERDIGVGIGLDNEAYQAAGARIVDSASELFATAEMIVKVKEPQPAESRLLRPGQIIFSYLHLAPDPELTQAILASGAIGIALETVTAANGTMPLLAPMSEIAGRLATQVGAHFLQRSEGGRGVLLGGAPGTEAGQVVIIGGGTVGLNAARMAIGLEAQVTLLDTSIDRLRVLEERYGRRIDLIAANLETIERAVASADLVIGAVLIPGAQAPRVITREMVAGMRKGSVIVDVAIDQGGCVETSRPTTHAAPTFEVDGVIHYCVSNMPSSVARTATLAFNNATLPYVLAIAGKGWQRALQDDPGLADGLSIARGRLTHPALAAPDDPRFLSAAEAVARG